MYSASNEEGRASWVSDDASKERSLVGREERKDETTNVIVHFFDLDELSLLLDPSEVNEEGGENVSLVVEPEEERFELIERGRQGREEETGLGELELDKVT